MSLTRTSKKLKLYVLYFATVLLLQGQACTAESDQCFECNVILISIDTLRPDHMGIYDYTKNTTPNIDSFFQNGTAYTNATSPAPCTLPAVKQILTSNLDFDSRRPRLAEILQGHDYKTSAVLSHHLFRNDQGARPGYARGFGIFDIQGKNEIDQHNMTTRGAAEVSDKALSWLQKNGRGSKFFLWLHYFDPHDPYTAPESHQRFHEKRLTNVTGDRRTVIKAAKRKRRLDKLGWQSTGAIFSDEEKQVLVGLYDAEISYVDAQISRVLSAIESANLLENSIIILTADHGERLGEVSGWWDHCSSLHSFELNVPLLVRVGGRPISGKRRSNIAVSSLDVVPTILGALQINTPEHRFDGDSLFEIDETHTVHARWNEVGLLRIGPWKLYVPKSSPPRLFKTDDDPLEQSNLVGEEPEQLEMMLDVLREKSTNRSAVNDRIEETNKELRALGYIQ